MTKNIFAILIITLFSISASAQEILTMPAYNPTVANQFSLKKSAAAFPNTISLPFYDDFSVISVFPSPLRWVDSSAFINTDYAKFPPSIGVATLDALNKQGALYPNSGAFPFDADYMTSLPIRLDSIFTPVKRALSRKDSIYFSFYYQPQGRAISPPSKKSSLILEFYSPGDNDTITLASGTKIVPRWRQKWSTDGGIQVDTFAGPDKKYFRQVLIPITGISDSAMYYKNGFQFRFRNIAALAANSQPDWRSNGSHWNIDVVYLHYGRSINDPFEDVAFGDIAPSMLVNYEAMPYRQYNKNFVNEMKDTLDIKIANLDNKNRNRTYKYNVRRNSIVTPFRYYDGEPYTISPYITNGYVTFKPWARPPVNFFYPFTEDKNIVFHITHSLSPDPNPLFRPNDTIRFTQVFSNYYAYDNGTSEAGIGINGAAGSYAIQFKLNEKDTLRGMQIYFNPMIGVTNQQIDLQVWNDANGKPGRIIKTLGGVSPQNSGKLNEFSSYWFEEPFVVEPPAFPSLIFYIGWTQSTVENLNVGFDRYKDSHTKRFFNISGNWEMSSEINYGSLMFRPVVGPENPLGVDKPSAVEYLSIRPNPVTDGNLIIQLPESWTKNTNNKPNISIISATGSRVLSETFHNPVNVNTLAPGFYLVFVTDKNSGRKATGKLIIK